MEKSGAPFSDRFQENAELCSNFCLEAPFSDLFQENAK